jgi:predicted O-methyltransferase YrrM
VSQAENGAEIDFAPSHHQSPIPDPGQLKKEPYRSRIWPKSPPETPGVDWRGKHQLALCRELGRQTPMTFPTAPTGDPHEYFASSGFPPLDATVLQAILRHFRPERMIEVGSGYSSLVTARVNREFLREGLRFTCIEPYPRDFLRAGVPGISELRVEEVQDTPLELFDALQDGDILFIDTTHVVKTGGDVQWLFSQVIPRLNPGVLVHLHDIFLPGDYPRKWVMQGWGCNEMYLVQGFLAFNYAFEVIFGVHWMIRNERDALREAFPHLSERDTSPWLAGSLWIRRVS